MSWPWVMLIICAVLLVLFTMDGRQQRKKRGRR